MNAEAPAEAIETPRLRLIPATPAMVDAELESAQALAQSLGAELPGDWPPEHHDTPTMQFTRDALARPGAAGWWLHYVVLTDAEPAVLAGTMGYKGPPSGGVVEIGYSVVPSLQRRGIAAEGCRALIETAWDRSADAVIAHTLPHLEPSIGVLRKLGFEPAAPPEPGVLAFELRR